MTSTAGRQRATGSARCVVLGLAAGVLLSLFSPSAHAIIDANGNGLDDIWEIIYGASGLASGADNDGDGATNAQESAAGTNPFDPNSRPALSITPASATQLQLSYTRVAGKRYRLESKTDLALPTWTPEQTEVASANGVATLLFNATGSAKFWRLIVDDVDTDSDGLTDAEERWLGFDPATSRTDRNDQTDLQRVNAGLNATSTVTLGVLNARMSERWPAPGVVVVRRSGGLRPITVNVAFSGTATRDTDYTASIAGNTVFIPAGVREVPISLNPIADSDDTEPTETIVVTLTSGAGYTLGATTSGTVNLENETATSRPAGGRRRAQGGRPRGRARRDVAQLRARARSGRLTSTQIRARRAALPFASCVRPGPRLLRRPR